MTLSASSNLRRSIMLITGCFLFVTGGVIVVALMSRHYSIESSRQTETLTVKFLPGLVTLAHLQESTLKLNGIALQFTLAKDDTAMKARQEDFQAQANNIAQYVRELKSADDSAGTRDRIASFVAAIEAYRPQVEKLRAELKAGDVEKAMATFDNDVVPGQRSVDTQLRLLSEHFFQLSQGLGHATLALIEHTRRFSTIGSAALVSVSVLSLLVALVGGRGVSRRLLHVASALKDGAGHVTSAAGQVSASSQSLAEGASAQAASLEETSASLEEMAGMTNRNAENASKANDLARQARVAADAGAADMQAMSTAMNDIKRSSDDIAKIIKTIDEIAFQTNILALNAAVEAARAGDAGLGFAVVADEVRALAQRSAQAARETADKIEGAITKTSQGVQISGKVARSLAEIVDKVRQVDELITEVSTASREQSQGVKQIARAVTEMDKIVQGNAASAEESASAAEQLNAQSVALQQAIGEVLRLTGDDSYDLVVSDQADTEIERVKGKLIRPTLIRKGGTNGLDRVFNRTKETPGAPRFSSNRADGAGGFADS